MNMKDKINTVMEDVRVDEKLKNGIMEAATTNSKAKFKMPLKQLTAAIIAITLTVSVTTVAASIYFWDNHVAKKYGADEQQQETLSKAGYAAQPQKDSSNKTLMSENNGISVSVEQTLCDKNSMYILLKVKSLNGFKLNYLDTKLHPWFEETLCKAGGYDIVAREGFVDDEFITSPNERYYEIFADGFDRTGSGRKNIDLSNETISLELKNIAIENEEFEQVNQVKGNWNLSWKNTAPSKMKTIQLDKKIEFRGNTITLGSISISPLSYLMTCSTTQSDDLPSADVPLSSSEDMYMIQKNISFIMKDGTIEDVCEPSYGVDSYVELMAPFKKVLDVDNVAAVKILDHEFPVE
jgi:hypothetical protein